MKNFHEYKKISQQVIDLLTKNNCSSFYDIEVIYNILMGFPFMLNGMNFLYRGECYSLENIDNIPEIGRIEFIQRYGKNTPFSDEFDTP